MDNYEKTKDATARKKCIEIDREIQKLKKQPKTSQEKLNSNLTQSYTMFEQNSPRFNSATHDEKWFISKNNENVSTKKDMMKQFKGSPNIKGRSTIHEVEEFEDLI